MPANLIDAILAEVVREGHVDWVEMAQLAEIISSVAEARDPAVIREFALTTIQRGIETGVLRLGLVRADGFHEVTGDPVGLRRAVAQQWPEDHLPGLGDIGYWLDVVER